jgi:hypothetical protein
VGINSPWANSSSLLPSMNNFPKEKWTKWQSQSNCPRERMGLGILNQEEMDLEIPSKLLQGVISLKRRGLCPMRKNGLHHKLANLSKFVLILSKIRFS